VANRVCLGPVSAVAQYSFWHQLQMYLLNLCCVLHHLDWLSDCGQTGTEMFSVDDRMYWTTTAASAVSILLYVHGAATEKAVLPIRRCVCDVTRSPDDEARSTDWAGTSVTGVSHQDMPSVLWRCWLGGRKGIRPVKNRVVGCWHGYLLGAMSRLAYGPADATGTHCVLLQ